MCGTVQHCCSLIRLHTIWEPLTEKRILQFYDDRISWHFPVRVARGVVNRSSFSVWILSVVSLVGGRCFTHFFFMCALGSCRVGCGEVFGIAVHEGERIPFLLCHRSSQVVREQMKW